MAVLPTGLVMPTPPDTQDEEHLAHHNELHDGHNLNETHRGRTDNPHATTAAQVGADPTGSAAAAQTAAQAALDTHKTSTDHDGRYYTEAEVNALVAALQALSEKGAANGYAPLGADAKVPAANLPAAGAAGGTLLGTALQTANHSVSNGLMTDTPGLSVAFTVPASGKVFVMANVLLTNNYTALHYTAIREGTTELAKQASYGPQNRVRVTYTYVIEGLTPGQAKTFKFAHKAEDNTKTATLEASASTPWGPGVMTVWAA